MDRGGTGPMSMPSALGKTSERVAAPESEILRLAMPEVTNARLVSFPGRDSYSCTIVVDTDAEKQRINGNPALIEEMKQAAGDAGRRPDYLSAESQEAVDRRWNGDWNYVWR
jgi:hypothetical protein